MVAVDDESFVIATYFEIIESAKDSTVDIQLLDVASIEGLSNAKRLALKLWTVYLWYLLFKWFYKRFLRIEIWFIFPYFAKFFWFFLLENPL